MFIGLGACASSAHAGYTYLSEGTSATPAVPYHTTPESVSQTGRPAIVTEKPLTLEEAIDTACSDPDNFEEEEVRPSPEAIGDLKRILNEASEIFGGDIPQGDVAPYFGEISVTWRHNNRMLRLTAFSDGREARLDFGTTPKGALGDYGFTPTATGDSLIQRLNWLLASRATAVTAV